MEGEGGGENSISHPRRHYKLLTFIGMGILQVVFILFFLAWIIICFIVNIIPVGLLGIYFFQAKVIAVGPVSNFYYKLWSGPRSIFGTSKDLVENTMEFDVEILNFSMVAHFANTFPQLIVQVYNNTQTDLWTNIAIFSTCLSVTYV